MWVASYLFTGILMWVTQREQKRGRTFQSGGFAVVRVARCSLCHYPVMAHCPLWVKVNLICLAEIAEESPGLIYMTICTTEIQSRLKRTTLLQTAKIGA